MTTTTAVRPRHVSTTVYVAHLAGQLQSHVHLAEKASARYDLIHRQLRNRHADKAKLLLAVQRNLDLADEASALAHHQRMASLYAAALTGEAAARTLLDGAL